MLLFRRCDVAGLTVILMVCCDHAECAMSKTYENRNVIFLPRRYHFESFEHAKAPDRCSRAAEARIHHDRRRNAFFRPAVTCFYRIKIMSDVSLISFFLSTLIRICKVFGVSRSLLHVCVFHTVMNAPPCPKCAKHDHITCTGTRSVMPTSTSLPPQVLQFQKVSLSP